MTINATQNTHIGKKQYQKSGVLSGSRDIFGFFKKSQVTPAIYTKYSDRNDLLKAAYKMLERAEQEIAEKNLRINNLEDILTIDELTSLTNRRGFFKSFERELDLTNRGNNKGGVLIMIDLDYFKTINDTFGHLAGDEALKKVGYFLQNTLRSMDIAARIGGDEFIVLMPSTTIDKSMTRAQKIGQMLNDLSFEWQGATINIRASLGLKEYKQGDTIKGIIAEADKGMYLDKKSKKQTLLTQSS